MAKSPATRRRFAQLSFEDGDVVVTPEDRDLFLISAKRATEACRYVLRLDEQVERFKSEFLVPLHEWCVALKGRVRACYIPIPGNHIQVFVLTDTSSFDFDLASDIATLELKLARSGWRVGVTQLPDAGEEALATFFHPEEALAVYAERGPAPQESGK